MLQAALLAGDVLSGTVQVWHIVVLSFFLGVVMLLIFPYGQSFVVEMISHHEDLGNAFALNSPWVNGCSTYRSYNCRTPSRFGREGVCFILNSASYLAVLVALVAMRLDPTPHHLKQRQNSVHELSRRPSLPSDSGLSGASCLLIAFGKLDGNAICGFGACLCKGSSPCVLILRVSHDSGRMRLLLLALYLASRKSVLRAWQANRFLPQFCSLVG